MTDDPRHGAAPSLGQADDHRRLCRGQALTRQADHPETVSLTSTCGQAAGQPSGAKADAAAPELRKKPTNTRFISRCSARKGFVSSVPRGAGAVRLRPHGMRSLVIMVASSVLPEAAGTRRRTAPAPAGP